MSEKLSWVTVALAAVVCSTVAVLLIAGVHVVDVIAAFGVAGTFISVLTYGKLVKVENNTNGTATTQLEMMKDLIEHVKVSVPVDVAKSNGHDE